MSNKTFRLMQSLLVTALAAYLIRLLVGGKLNNYIHQRFTYLIVIAILLLLILAGLGFLSLGRLPSSKTKMATLPLYIMALPVIFGFFIPIKPLSNEALQSKGVNMGFADLANQSEQDLIPSEMRTILDWVRLLKAENETPSFIGQEAKVVGFVFLDPRLEAHQFAVARFVIACCVADATAVAMVIDLPDQDLPPEGAWVEVSGTMDIINVEDEDIPLIHATQIKVIPIPDDPYLFP